MLVLDTLKVDWEYVMLIGAVFHLFMSLIVFLILKERPRKDKQLLSDNPEEVEGSGRV
jgi:hypothetical protein